MRHLLRALLLLALITSGCADHGPGKPQARPARPVIVTPSATQTGRVVSVDVPARFVVLSFPPGRLPEAERRYQLYRRGLKVAEVRIGGLRTADTTVADILVGEAQAGDEARPE